MEKFMFHEIVIGIMVGDVVDGDVFESDTGAQIVYKDGALCWLTSTGYVSTPVAVTKEIIPETFTKVMERNTVTVKLNFAEALDYLATEKGEVGANIGGSTYTIKNFSDLDNIIENYEYVSDMFKGEYTVEVEVEEGKAPTADEQEPTEEEEKETAHNKLTYREAYNIHVRYHIFKQPVPEIAELYGISTRMVYYILDGTYWNTAYKSFHEE